MARNGRDCILVSGLLLVVCGFCAMISSFSAQSIVDTAMKEACKLIIEDETCLSEAGTTACRENCTGDLGSSAAYDNCISNCKAERASDYAISMQDCQAELRSQSGCGCESDGDGGWRCDCEGQLVGLIQEYWDATCYILGCVAFVCGVLCTGLPAVTIAIRGSRGWCCRVTCYSTCAALWFLPFLGIGGVFIMVAFLHQWQGDITDTLNNCEADVSDSTSGGSLTINFESGSNCGLTAFCDALQSVSGDIMIPSLAVGIPFLGGGIVMLFGSYAVCCCASSLPDGKRISDEELAKELADDGAPKSARSHSKSRSASRQNSPRGSKKDVFGGSKKDVMGGSRKNLLDDGPKSARSHRSGRDGPAKIDVTNIDKASFIRERMGELGPQPSWKKRAEGYDSHRAKENVEDTDDGDRPQLGKWEQELQAAEEAKKQEEETRAESRLGRAESKRMARAASRGGSSRQGHDWRAALENLAQEREAEREEEAATLIQRGMRSARDKKSNADPREERGEDGLGSARGDVRAAPRTGESSEGQERGKGDEATPR